MAWQSMLWRDNGNKPMAFVLSQSFRKGHLQSRVAKHNRLQLVHLQLLLLSFFVCTIPLPAQLLPDVFRRLTVDDGLPSNNLSDVFQDSRHYLWVGTINGLCRYNGREFEQFVDDPTLKNRLKGDFVRSLYEDEEGFIYVLNHGGGLHRYDYHHPEQGFQQLISGAAFPKLKGMGISSFILYADQHETYILYDDTIRRYDFINQKISNYDPFEHDPEYGGFKIKSFKAIRYAGNIVVGFHSKLGLLAFNIKSGERSAGGLFYFLWCA